MPQILGLHYKRLGFKSVGAFWDFMKASLNNQITMMLKFLGEQFLMLLTL
jgi:hypothetical protein